MEQVILQEHGIFPTIEQVFEQPHLVVEQLQDSQHRRLWFKLLSIALLGYGIFGLSAAAMRGGMSLALSVALYPLVFLGALLLSVPALYIFSSFLGSQWHPKEIAAVALLAMLVPGVILAGMAPIHWFFAVSTRSTTLMNLTNFLALVVAAWLGYKVTHQLLHPRAITQPSSTSSKPSSSKPQLLLLWFGLYLGMLFKLMSLTHI